MGAFEDDPTITDNDRIYMERAQATATVPLIFLNPDALDRAYFETHQKQINPSDIQVFREMMDSQISGISTRYPDEGILHIAGLSMDGRHFSLQQEIPAENDRDAFSYAFINLQGNNRTPSDLETSLFSRNPEAEYYWSGFWGMHEGSHAGFEHLAHNATLNFGQPGKNEALAINAELSADREGLEWLRSQGQEEVAQAVIDYRALNAFADPSHAATAILDDEPGVDATVEHFIAARQFTGVMLEAVGQDLNIDTFSVIDLSRSHPGALNNHVQRLFDEGRFDAASANPHVREFIEAYLGAYERQVSSQTQAPEADIDLRTDRTLLEQDRVAASPPEPDKTFPDETGATVNQSERTPETPAWVGPKL